jgi:hypothetical protein
VSLWKRRAGVPDVKVLSLDLFCESAVKRYWEIIADNLSKAGWSWGCVSAVASEGRTIWIADAHGGDGKLGRVVHDLPFDGVKLLIIWRTKPLR